MSDNNNAQNPGSTARLLSVVLPAHNEREVLRQTYQQVSAACAGLAAEGLEYELVFVNDGSTDGSDDALDSLAVDDPRIRVGHLTRNFGHQAAVTAGLSLARGDVVAIMDADLQDPPEVLISLLAKWREGYQVVYGVRRKRKEGLLRRVAYWGFYRLMNSVSEVPMPLDSGDFCVLDRSAVDLLARLPERQRFVRGLRSWIGLKQVGVEYERNARFAGRPSYTFGSLIKLALDGLVSFSVAPLRLTTKLGILGVIVAILLGIWILIVTIFEVTAPRGWASLACLTIFSGSIQMISLGIIGEYLSRIFLEVKQRPTFLIARVTGRDSGPLSSDPRGAELRTE